MTATVILPERSLGMKLVAFDLVAYFADYVCVLLVILPCSGFALHSVSLFGWDMMMISE